MIVVRSEDGRFLGEVGRFSVNERDHYNEEKGCYCTFVITADHGTEGGCDLAEYKTKEAAIKQIDDMQQCVNNGTVTTENMEMYGQPQVSVTTLFVYDLRERKIED